MNKTCIALALAGMVGAASGSGTVPSVMSGLVSVVSLPLDVQPAAAMANAAKVMVSVVRMIFIG